MSTFSSKTNRNLRSRSFGVGILGAAVHEANLHKLICKIKKPAWDSWFIWSNIQINLQSKEASQRAKMHV